ncbi:protein NETWORKED 3A [Senna tora]|uniref:Protein NETWORKED 3A n=1 Tax=Senna tora TaxID=362788 RepID=A0A835CED3_9FABA|nr:protein NETWORKED 3A [Senna tora]
MANAKDEESAPSFSWWQDSHSRPSQVQSQWLRATLSDLDEKTRVMVSIIDQKEGDSFGRRAEMFYRRRPELVGTIQELHNLYGCLAQRYKQLQTISPSVKESSILISAEKAGKRVEEAEARSSKDDKDKDRDMDVGLGLRLRIMKLAEDSLCEQAELLRRNNEKREAIRYFRSRVDRLVDQYRDIKSSFPVHAPHAQRITRIHDYDATSSLTNSTKFPFNFTC